jgi:hypothetical protein
VFAAWMRVDCCRGAWLDDAYDRQRRQRLAQSLERYRRCRVTGNDQQFDPLLLQFCGCLGRIALDRRRALGAIWEARRIAESPPTPESKTPMGKSF